MGRVFGILLIVVALWVGAEIFTQGVDGAFGGILARGKDPAAAESAPVTRRAGDAVQRAYDHSEDRIERALEDASP